MTTPWQRRRRGIARSDGARRGDAAAQCLLPYPNDWFTRHDPTSATGRRLDLNVLAMPRNVEGKPIVHLLESH